MSDSELPPDPVPQPEPSPTDPVPQPESTSTDPLLDSGSYIDPGRNNSAAAAEQPQPQPPEFAPGVVIAAEPISMYVPGEDSAEATPKAGRRRRDPDEMAKRPSWLPEDWKIDLRVRSSGATAGLIDRYYVEPKGERKFRSKIEVLHFLETGSKPKRKLTSETETTPSGSPVSEKQKKSQTKRKKSEAVVSDNTQPSNVLNGVQADNAQQI